MEVRAAAWPLAQSVDPAGFLCAFQPRATSAPGSGGPRGPDPARPRTKARRKFRRRAAFLVPALAGSKPADRDQFHPPGGERKPSAPWSCLVDQAVFGPNITVKTVNVGQAGRRLHLPFRLVSRDRLRIRVFPERLHGSMSRRTRFPSPRSCSQTQIPPMLRPGEIGVEGPRSTIFGTAIRRCRPLAEHQRPSRSSRPLLSSTGEPPAPRRSQSVLKAIEVPLRPIRSA